MEITPRKVQLRVADRPGVFGPFIMSLRPGGRQVDLSTRAQARARTGAGRGPQELFGLGWIYAFRCCWRSPELGGPNGSAAVI